MNPFEYGKPYVLQQVIPKKNRNPNITQPQNISWVPGYAQIGRGK